MTRTEERLADALDAAARAMPEEDMRPFIVPVRRQPRLAWAAPAASAAGLLLVVGLAVAVAGHLPGSGQLNSAVSTPPRYYVEADLNGDPPVVRSTAAGSVTATVRVPHVSNAAESYVVTAAANGLFFAATGARIYRFRLTASGQVSGLEPVRSGLPGGNWTPAAMAASPDGSRVAVALWSTNASASTSCSGDSACSTSTLAASSTGLSGLGSVVAEADDQIDVVSTATGATSRWAGGIGQGYSFSVISLSWTRNGDELAYFGQWCPQHGANTTTSCLEGTGTGGAKAQLRTLNLASNGGSLTSGQSLFSVSAKYPFVPQAMISADGSAIIAVVATGPPTRGAAATRPLTQVAVEQIPLAAAKQPSVLYSRPVSESTLFTLSTDATDQHWMFSGACSDRPCTNGFNGWINNGRLVPLQPTNGILGDEAW
jgi:hypothetical protein